ncbi:signal recognition particle protein [bacterium]|nr:signal recognition particle protein [bacterium]
MFDALGSSLRASLRRLTGSGRISAADLEAGLADIRTSLVGADVAMPVVAQVLERIRERARASEIVGGLGAGERMLGILHSALTETLGGSGRDLDLRERPATILLLGLQGAGKTTTAAKLAYRLAKDGRRPLLVVADPRRPAAAEQLATLAAAVKVPMHREPIGTPVAEIGTRAIAAARRLGLDVVIIDSSGRTTLDDELLEELRHLRDATKPRERLLVLDAATGQSALAIANGFKAVAEPTGLILSKLDGDARGGAALSIAGGAGIPVVFVGTGERSDALERFHPERIANRILDMGDLATLAERVRDAEIGPAAGPDAEVRAKAAEARALRGGMTFDDLLGQLRQMSSLGPIGQVVKMIPGMGGMAEQAEAAVASGELKRTEAIILSMTPAERRDPALLTLPRRRRIAAGAGRAIEEVNRLVKRLEEMRTLMRRAGGGDPSRLMGGGAGLPGKHAGGRIPPKAAKREKRAKKGGKRR